MKTVGVIPARYGSSRFPGKPLVKILGKPMIQWVYEHALAIAGLDKVVIATDDSRISETAEGFGAEVIMTPADCPSPTERLFLVSQSVDADFFVMINGDEPTLSPDIISKCIPDNLQSPEIYVRNLMTKCSNPTDVIDTTNIKVVTNKFGDCMYMSRSPIPFPKGAPVGRYMKFVGVTGFTRSALQFYHDTPIGEVERAEDVDELRFVENGKRVEFVEVTVNSLSVDSPKDIAVVEDLLKRECGCNL